MVTRYTNPGVTKNVDHSPHPCPPRMVYVNNKKFACESCIKGHRSSSCHHTDRPLFEIKKKGRPVSQCEKCRELRQSKKLHSKCTCTHKPGAKEATQLLVASSTSKTKRFIPIVPALPNGLKDVLSHPTPQPDERQTVNSLLNPCNCGSVLKCKCTVNESPAQHRVIATGLSALATAAASMQAIPPFPGRSEPSSSDILGKRPLQPRTEPKTSIQSPCKHHKGDGSSWSRTIHLPPLTHPVPSSSSGSTPQSTSSLPDFGIMPPINQITSIAGSGCTCGVRCACPGCVDHKRGDHAQKCGDGCGNCIDPTLEFSLPTAVKVGNSSNNSKESFLDRFFACAAALPPPPEHRRLSIQLNPVDMTPYSNKSGPPVNLPKLECCGGRCTCPNGQCSCKKSCVACSADEVEEPGVSFERQKVSQPSVVSAPIV